MNRRAFLKKATKQRVNYRILSSVAALVVIAAASIFIGMHQHDNTKSKTAGDTKFLTQKWLAQCYTQECVNSGLEAITADAGTEAALDSLDYYDHHISNYLSGDNHLRAHRIGNQTFLTYGLSSQTFLRCGTGFNYGCMHGYIEEAEAKMKGTTSLSLAKLLCGPIEINSSYSINRAHFCYHGIGHGILEDVNYDLQVALGQCDQFESQLAQTGCWQGVFMQNEWGYVSREANNGTFSKTDPLAPCDRVAEKYQSQCYVNQEGYLFNYFHSDVSKAAHACLGAGVQAANCIEGIGLAASSEVWQPDLLRGQDTGSIESNAWLICKEFPKQYISTCVTGAVFQILEVDSLNFSRASKFCGLVSSASQAVCYRSIGQYAWVESPASERQKAYSYCQQLPVKWQATCIQGTKEYET